MIVDLVQCSPHAVTGFIGLALLTIQTVLPTLFKVKKKKESFVQEFLILMILFWDQETGCCCFFEICAGQA